MKGLTKRQEEILEYIIQIIEENGYCPSLDEIASHFSFSTPAAYYSVRALEEKGVLSYTKNKKRAITLSSLERERRTNLPFPFFSKEPTLSEINEGADETILLPALYSSRDIFAFKVSSSSMDNSGILPGDIAIVEKINRVIDNSIVLASKDEYSPSELRRLHISPQAMELWAENDTMGIIRSRKFPIYGILLELRRIY